MSLDALAQSLPPYARDLGRNLDVLVGEEVLSAQQKWGCFIACAHAGGVPPVVSAVEAAAAMAGLSETAATAAKAAAAVMGMNNVYYRALHLLHNPEYRALPAHLRMNVIRDPGVDKADFELWCMAVSALNGCGACLDAHDTELKRRGVAPIAIQASMRIAAVVAAVSRVLASEAAAA